MKETEELLSFLRGVMYLEPNTGRLIWKPRLTLFAKDRQWNGRFAGKEVGSLRPDGYKRTGFNFGEGMTYVLLHRIVWAFCTGVWPTSDIDHINQVKHDNRPENLRVASRTQNIANRTQVNSTGFKGVMHDPRSDSYQARIMFKGKAIHLLSSKDPIAAARAYDTAAIEYYGEFAHTNFER